MKAITLLMIAVLYTALSFAQVEPSMTTQTGPTASVVKTHYTKETQKSIYREYSTGECHKWHTMKVAGIVLSAVGGGLFVTGATMVAIDNRNTYVYGEGYYGPYHPLRAGGGAMIGTGIICMGAGIPLAIVGGVKGRRYCGARAIPSQSYLELNNGSNGTGLALKF